MKLTKAERLILVMLCDLHEHLKIKSEVDQKLIKSAIFSGNTWGIEWDRTDLLMWRRPTKML